MKSATKSHIHLIEVAPNLGHGPLWLGYLIDALQPATGKLSVTYPDLDEYRDVVQQKCAAHASLTARPFKWRGGKNAWRASLSGASDLQADLTLIPDLGVPLKRAHDDLRRYTGSPIRGIWFNPGPRRRGTFWNPKRLVSSTARNLHREQQVLRQVPDWLSGIWVLDDVLVERIESRADLAIHVLPDPWPTTPSVDRSDARRALGLPPNTQLFLHLGVDAPRKGLDDAARAWLSLPEADDAVLLRVGPTDRRKVTGIDRLLARERMLVVDHRVSDEQLDMYLRACDWVLLPYREHHGSSGLLTGAAAAGRPVIAADFGVLGQRVRDAGLGLVYSQSSVPALAAAVQEALRTPTERFSDGLKQYARTHDLAHFSMALNASLSRPAS